MTVNSAGTLPIPSDIKHLSLRANFSWTFFGQLIYVSCQWGMLAVLAKLGSPEMLGLFSLGLAVTTPIIVFSMLQLRAVQATDARREYKFSHYLALRLTTCLLALLAISAVAYIAGYPKESAYMIVAVGVFKAVEAISDVYHGLMQQRDRMDRSALALMIKGPLFLLGLVMMVYLTGSVIWGIIAATVFSLAVLLTYERANAAVLLSRETGSSVRPRWEWRELAKLAGLSLPLGFVMMLIALNTNIPRYFIERALGLRELGYFSALVYPQAAGVMIVGALGQAASPRLATYFAEGRRGEFFQLLGKMVLVGIALSIAAVLIATLFGREILTLLYETDYAEHHAAFVWLMAAAGLSFVASFLGYGMTAARRFRVQVPLFIGSALIGALACALLIPAGGLIGAAKALLLASLAQTAGSAAVVVWAMERMKGS